jgi:very-short-patch-repair endonuclease
LWQRLRGKQTGFKFRRQHPIGPYVVDFYCSIVRLAVEIDGLAHDSADRVTRDEARDRFLTENGHDVLHLLASDIVRDLDGAVAAIVARGESPLHQPAAGPPPRAGEDS